MRWPCCLFGLLLCAPLHAQGWVTAPPKSVQIDPSGKAQIQADGSILVPPAEGLRRYRVECIVNQDSIGALRIEVLPHASLPGKGPGHGAKGNLALT